MTAQSKDEDYGWPLILTGLVIGMLYAPYVEGWVIARLWSWYAMPLGARAVSWKVFAAVLLAASLFQSRRSSRDSRSDFVSRLGQAVILPWLILLAGWIPL